MRCSACEPLLDRYVEGTLKPPQMIAITAHLRDCESCRALLEELRAVDGLFATTPVMDLPQNFTFAVMAEARALPAPRAPHRPLLARCWQLRDNLTVYDAAYVALAEAMHATLLTADRRLARAPGPQCPIEILQPAAVMPAPEPPDNHEE